MMDCRWPARRRAEHRAQEAVTAAFLQALAEFAGPHPDGQCPSPDCPCESLAGQIEARAIKIAAAELGIPAEELAVSDAGAS